MGFVNHYNAMFLIYITDEVKQTEVYDLVLNKIDHDDRFSSYSNKKDELGFVRGYLNCNENIKSISLSLMKAIAKDLSKVGAGNELVIFSYEKIKVEVTGQATGGAWVDGHETYIFLNNKLYDSTSISLFETNSLSELVSGVVNDGEEIVLTTAKKKSK